MQFFGVCLVILVSLELFAASPVDSNNTLVANTTLPVTPAVSDQSTLSPLNNSVLNVPSSDFAGITPRSTVSMPGSSLAVVQQSPAISNPSLNSGPPLVAMPTGSSNQPTTGNVPLMSPSVVTQQQQQQQQQSVGSSSNVAASTVVLPVVEPLASNTPLIQPQTVVQTLPSSTPLIQRQSATNAASVPLQSSGLPSLLTTTSATTTTQPSTRMTSLPPVPSSTPQVSVLPVQSSPAVSPQQRSTDVGGSSLPMTSSFVSALTSRPVSGGVQSSVFATQWTSFMTTLYLTSESARHIQITFANIYKQTIPAGTDLTAYCARLQPSVAMAARVRQDRITDMSIASQPETDCVVLRFTIQPIPSTGCESLVDCGVNVEYAVHLLDDLVNTAKLRLNDTTPLTIDQNSVYQPFQQWTDNGRCPINYCNSGTQVCDCSLTGSLYCRDTGGRNQLLYLLLLLLLIPIIIAIIVIACCVVRKRKQRVAEDAKKTEKRRVRADMLSYHEYSDKQQVQPTIASRSTLNEGTLNSLYRSLGENISIAFNGATFVDCTAGTDNSDCSSSSSILPNNNQ